MRIVTLPIVPTLALYSDHDWPVSYIQSNTGLTMSIVTQFPPDLWQGHTHVLPYTSDLQGIENGSRRGTSTGQVTETNEEVIQRGTGHQRLQRRVHVTAVSRIPKATQREVSAPVNQRLVQPFYNRQKTSFSHTRARLHRKSQTPRKTQQICKYGNLSGRSVRTRGRSFVYGARGCATEGITADRDYEVPN